MLVAVNAVINCVSISGATEVFVLMLFSVIYSILDGIIFVILLQSHLLLIIR